jgi:hypothetical protein
MLEVHAGDAEALPHVHKGHYFNVMNVFGLGGGKCEYSLANSTADTSFYNTPIVRSQTRDRKGIFYKYSIDNINVTHDKFNVRYKLFYIYIFIF